MATAEDKVVLERLDVDNYAVWSLRMKAYLMIKGLWKAVTGESTDVEMGQKALSQIVLHVKDHHLANLVSCTSTKERTYFSGIAL
jgi:hypothetical protein